jgi:hypothetical protein
MSLDKMVIHKTAALFATETMTKKPSYYLADDEEASLTFWLKPSWISSKADPWFNLEQAGRLAMD